MFLILIAPLVVCSISGHPTHDTVDQLDHDHAVPDHSPMFIYLSIYLYIYNELNPIITLLSKISVIHGNNLITMWCPPDISWLKKKP